MYLQHLNIRTINIKYRFVQNDCRGFNNLSYTIHLRQDYLYFFIFVTYLAGALYVHPL